MRNPLAEVIRTISRGPSALPSREIPNSRLEQEVAQMFEQLRNPLFRYVLSLGLSPQDAEEIIQECFLLLFQHLQAGKDRSNLRGWIFRVAHNLGLKQRSRQSQYGSTEADELSSHPHPDPDPEQLFASRQRQQRLRAALNALSEQDRSCLSLRAEGLRYREIAEVLNVSLGSVAQSLERGLTRLARLDERLG